MNIQNVVMNDIFGVEMRMKQLGARFPTLSPNGEPIKYFFEPPQMGFTLRTFSFQWLKIFVKI